MYFIGDAKNNRVVLVALYPVLKESFKMYYDITEIMGVLVDRFMELEVPDCVKIQEIFCRISKQFEELDYFYSWSKGMGIARSSDYPEVEKITPKKLEIMDEFIRDKSILARSRRPSFKAPSPQVSETVEETPQEAEEDINAMKALPPPEGFVVEDQKEEIKEEESKDDLINTQTQPEPDLLDLREDNMTNEYQGDKLALALFDGGAETGPSQPAWEAFKPEEKADWEVALVETASSLSNQQASLGGGFDKLLLDGMYQQSAMSAAMAGTVGNSQISGL